MQKYTQRAQDALDMVVVVDVYLTRIKSVCKDSVAHTVGRQVARLQGVKLLLEKELIVLQETAAGLLSWFKKLAKLRELKQKITDINGQIVKWINSIYRYFIA